MSSLFPTFGLIPLDARPVCRQQPLLLAQLAGVRLTTPPEALLGHLKQPAHLDGLAHWQTTLVTPPAIWITATDTLAYGGLIPSRLGHEPLPLCQERLTSWLTPQLDRGNTVLAFSSILRIPHYNGDEEEPPYWQHHGQAIHQASTTRHRDAALTTLSPDGLAPIPPEIPADVWADFTARLWRNHQLNLWLATTWAGHPHLPAMAFCQDDTSSHGLNVLAAQDLAQTLTTRHLPPQAAWIQTGADELASVLLARALLLATDTRLTCHIRFSNPATKDMIARYDGVSFQTIAERSATACGLTLVDTPEGADLTLWLHTSDTRQGDHCMDPLDGLPYEHNPTGLATLHDALATTPTPIALADVAYANGADPDLTQHLLTQVLPFPHTRDALYGYAAWNTGGNTVGTALAMATCRLWAERHGRYHPDAFHQLLAIRLLDDGLYQPTVRRHLQHTHHLSPTAPDTPQRLADALTPTAQQLATHLALPHLPQFCLPLRRWFEVAITF